MTNKYESKSFEAQISGRTVAPQSEDITTYFTQNLEFLTKTLV